jgi:hypothetical protein
MMAPKMANASRHHIRGSTDVCKGKSHFMPGAGRGKRKQQPNKKTHNGRMLRRMPMMNMWWAPRDRVTGVAPSTTTALSPRLTHPERDLNPAFMIASKVFSCNSCGGRTRARIAVVAQSGRSMPLYR